MTKILLCDDDEGVIEVIKIILEENNYQVQTLSQGRGIKKKALEYKPDLIFLDIWMRGIDGVEITRLLKNDSRFKKVPIILISALDEIEKIKNRCGADDFLSKPFDIADLLSLVKKYAS